MNLTSLVRPCLSAGILLLIAAGCATGPGRATVAPADIAFTGDFDHPPVVKSMPRTQYPPLLRGRGVGGSAIVTFTVNARGRVQDSKVESASETAFGGAAIGTVGPMEFDPATKDGKPVPALGTATFNFDPDP